MRLLSPPITTPSPSIHLPRHIKSIIEHPTNLTSYQNKTNNNQKKTKETGYQALPDPQPYANPCHPVVIMNRHPLPQVVKYHGRRPSCCLNTVSNKPLICLYPPSIFTYVHAISRCCFPRSRMPYTANQPIAGKRLSRNWP